MLSFQSQPEDLIHGYKAMIVSPNGEINSRSVRQFEKQLQDYYNVGYRFIVINCAHISSLSSEGLTMMMNMVETYQKAGGILLMIRALPQISRFFDIEGYSPIFTSLTSEQEAMQYLNNQLQQAFESGNVAAATPPTPQTSVAPPQLTAQPPAQQLTVNYPQPQPSAESGNTSRKYNVTRQVLPMVDVEVHYHKKMYCRRVFPLIITVTVPEKQHSSQTILVTPVFPGCLAVPSSRAVAIREQKTTFWVTPLIAQKMKGSIEFSREDKINQVELPFKITRQHWSKLLLLSGVAVLLLLKWNPPQASSAIEQLSRCLGRQFPGIYLGIAAAASLLLLALTAFLLNRPRTAKPVLTRLNLK